MPATKATQRLWWWVVLAAPALVKLCFLHVDTIFEAHTMALEWMASGKLRHHYLGQWDSAFQFPVYTMVIAATYITGLGTTAVLVFQVACSVITAWLIGRLALVLLNGRVYAVNVALIVALVTGLNPFLAYYQVRMIHPFAWDMLLATALLYGSFTASPARTRSLVLLFAFAGVVILNRPTLGVFLLPLLREGRALFAFRPWLPKLVCVVLLFAPITGWLLRNHHATGRVQLTSVTDQMIWMGLQEGTEGSGHLPNGDHYMHLLSVPERHLLFELDPAGRSDFFRGKWKAEIELSPGLRWRMFLVKLKNFWLFRSHPGVGNEGALRTWGALAYKVYALLMFACVLLSLWWRDRSSLWVLAAVFLLSVLQCMFYFETRHRLLVEPMLTLIAVTAIAEVVRRAKPAV